MKRKAEITRMGSKVRCWKRWHNNNNNDDDNDGGGDDEGKKAIIKLFDMLIATFQLFNTKIKWNTRNTLCVCVYVWVVLNA